MNNTTLKYPWMREELCDFLNDLRDIDRQRTDYKMHSTDENYYYELDDYMHYFFDDTNLSRDPESYIGTNLLNEGEAAAIAAVTSSLGRLIDRYKRSLTSKEYLKTPEWLEVVEAARAAHTMICPCTGPT